MNYRFFLLLSIFSFAITISFAQGKGKIGLSGSLQENQYGILIPIWITDNLSIAPAFDFKYAEKIGTDFSLGIVPRFYIKTEKFSPYFGLKFGALFNISSSEYVINNTTSKKETTIDIIGGLAFGAEYFLSENFSFGLEVQGNLTKSDKNSSRFGNPNGINFNTGTAISATIYF